MSDSLDLAKPGRKLHAGVILLGGITEILDVAPIDLINGLNPILLNSLPIPDSIKSQAQEIDIHWINEYGTDAQLTCSMTVKTTDSFANCPDLDIVLMGATLMGYTASETELAFVRKQYEVCTSFISVCGGFQAPLEAGLYKGKTVTAPRFIIHELSKAHPETTFLEKRYVHDGKLWTSGALLNGQDLMRAWASHHWGEAEGTVMGVLLNVGSWGTRDIDYKDGP